MLTKGESSRSVIPPSTLNSAFTGLTTSAYPPTLLAKLDAARRANDRVLLSFTGHEHAKRDSNGFSMTKWKALVDRYRGIDFSSYIADGTLIGHYILDEPNDRSNWNGHQVSLSDIEEMARYSKEIWPDLPAIIRAWPEYLQGYHFKYLDAAWAQYHVRFGDIEPFIATNVRQAKALGLALVTGLNLLSGGGEGGIPGYYPEKFAMTASQVRLWGGALLSEPYFCALFMFRYIPDYFERPDIHAAMAELRQKAQSHPKQACRRS